MQRRIIGDSLVIVIVLLIGSGAFAKDEASTSAESSTATRAEAIRRQRRAIADEIKALADAAGSNSAQGSVSDEATKTGKSAASPEVVTSLKALDALLVQHEALLEQRRQLEAELKQADEATKTLQEFGPDEPKPYSFLLLDELEDRLAVEKDRQVAIKSDVKLAERLLEGAHEELNSAATAKHEKPAKQAAAVEHGPAAPAGGLNVADLPLAVPREKVRIKQLGVEVQKLKLDVCQAAQQELGKKIELIKKDVVFSSPDREKQFDRLADKEAQLRRRRQQVQSQLQIADADQAQQLEQLTAQDPSPKVIDAAKAAWRTAVDSYQAEVLLLDQQLESLGDVRRFWKRRYELATRKIEPDKLTHWRDDAGELADQLHDTARSLEHRREAVNADLAAGTGRDAAPGHEPAADQGLAHWRDFRADRLKDLRDLIDQRLAEIKATERTLGRFQDELKAKLKAVPGAWPGTLAGLGRAVLGYKVVGSDEQSVTIGSVLLLLTYIVIGMLTASFISRVILYRLLLRVGMHRGTADALHTIGFYLLCIFFGVLAFQMLQIPLAAFAFLGGAAAIAVGFGGQDIMNNFMSGIILLTEQPIRVGDVIELSSTQGVVQHIGLRSTRIRTQNNHELIVPNKNLLDEQVTNLTLSDNFVMASVTVCLDRTVAVTPAMLQMHEVVFLHPMVIKSPRPVVLLKEFDPYWSTFEICFWLEYASYMKCAMVQSQVLETISNLFPEKEASGNSSQEAAATAEAADSVAKDADAAAPAEASTGEQPAKVVDVDGSAPAPADSGFKNGMDLAELNRKTAAAVARQVKRAGNLAKRKL